MSTAVSVKLRLVGTDGKVCFRNDGRRVLTVPPVPLAVDGRLFVYRATEGDGTRIYHEAIPLALDGLSVLQREYVALTETIANPALHNGFGGKHTGIEHGTAVVRRQAIAFFLVEQEILRIQKQTTRTG